MAEITATHGIKFKDSFGYALGDFAGCLGFALVSSFLQMFYTDSLHIPLQQITVLMLVARIWDAVNDPMWGAFVDSRKPTKYGRFRPYIYGASFPFALSMVLMFVKIPGLTTNQYLIYAYVTYIFFGMMYTGTNIPYGSLASTITDDDMERSSLSMWRSVGAGLGGLPAQIILPMLVYSVSAAGEKVLDSNKLTIAVACLAFLSLVGFFGHFKMTKERITVSTAQQQQKYSLIKAVKALIKNRPFISLCIVSMLLIAFQMYTQTTYNYLLKNFYGRPELYSLVTVFTYLPMAMFLPFMSRLVKKFGKKELCCAGLLFSAVINIIMYLIGFSPLVSNPYIFLLLLFFSGAGQTFILLEVWALVMDVIDYHQYISGRREEGTSYAVYSFTRKIGHTLAGAGSSAVLLAIGYDVNATDIGQSAEVSAKLYDISTLVPAIILTLMFLILTFGYKLSRSKLEEIKSKIGEQK